MLPRKGKALLKLLLLLCEKTVFPGQDSHSSNRKRRSWQTTGGEGKERKSDRIISSHPVDNKMDLSDQLNNVLANNQHINATEIHNAIKNKPESSGEMNNVVADAARTVGTLIGQGVIDGVGLMITPIQGLLSPKNHHPSGNEASHGKSIQSGIKPNSVSR